MSPRRWMKPVMWAVLSFGAWAILAAVAVGIVLVPEIMVKRVVLALSHLLVLLAGVWWRDRGHARELEAANARKDEAIAAGLVQAFHAERTEHVLAAVVTEPSDGEAAEPADTRIGDDLDPEPWISPAAETTEAR